MYYKNPLKNVICVLRDGLKQYRRYELNIGMVDNENRDDYFNPKKNRNMINIAGVYETEDFLLFFYGYKEKAYWMLYNPQNHPSTFSKRSVSILRFFSKTKRLF